MDMFVLVYSIMNQVKLYHWLFDKQLIISRIRVHLSLLRLASIAIVEGLNEPGIFRRGALVSLIKQIQEKYNEGSIDLS